MALASEISVVNLDPSRQVFGGIPLHHHLHQLVLDLPGCGLGDAESAPQLNAGNAALALGEVVDRAKPDAQRQLGGGEDRPGDQRGLPAAGGALVERAGFDDAVLAPAANRADEAARPAPAKHRIPASIFSSIQIIKPRLAETLLEPYPCYAPSPISQKRSYVPVLYPMKAAEGSAQSGKNLMLPAALSQQRHLFLPFGQAQSRRFGGNPLDGGRSGCVKDLTTPSAR